MDVVFVLLPIVLLLALAGVVAFLWALRRGQFDDLETPAVRILFDDDEKTADKDSDQSKTKGEL